MSAHGMALSIRAHDTRIDLFLGLAHRAVGLIIWQQDSVGRTKEWRRYVSGCVLVEGYPGNAVCHGGLGWSRIALLRGCNRTILVDAGPFAVRRELLKQLREKGVEPAAVTQVVLTHAHYDHTVNFTLFPEATIWIGKGELAWAERQAPVFDPLPERYVRELASSSRVRRVAAKEMFIGGIGAIAARVHTPRSLLFGLGANEPRVIFTGDAAKNRAELLSYNMDAAADRAASRGTIDRNQIDGKS